jgi:CelD/BcsL family acetyltransferase involved in cellulose biosynthesis
VRRRGVDWLEFIGAATLHEPTALLTDTDSSARALCKALVDARRPFVLQRIPMDSGVMGLLSACAKGRGTLLVARNAPCLRVDISGSWDEYLAGRSSQVRSGLRRKRAMLEQGGPISFELLRPQPADLPAILEEAIAIEADGWKEAAGSSLRRNAALREFVCALSERFAAAGALRVGFLRAAGQGVAMSILLEHDQRYWEIKIGYRESVSRASPGRLLLWETLREAFNRGMRGYEFLGSGDGQQPDWATGSTALHTLVYYPWTPAGLRALATDAGARVLRRLRR